MSAAIVVGYTATDAGADAVALGVGLAKSLAAPLHLVVVLPAEGTRSAAVPPERAYEGVLRAEAKKWLREAVDGLPEGLSASGHVRVGESFAEGLIAAGEEFDAALIVAGSAADGLFGRHRLGSVASELLHSSTIPVALAPRGWAGAPSAALTRVTAALGTRPGAEVLLDEAATLSTVAGVPLRLVSLVALDLPAGLDTGAIQVHRDEHAASVLLQAQQALAGRVATETDEVVGASVEDAVATLTWQPGEVLIVGSSRLAQPRRLFLGSTAAKMLHVLPVPMIVVPRSRAASKETAHDHRS